MKSMFMEVSVENLDVVGHVSFNINNHFVLWLSNVLHLGRVNLVEVQQALNVDFTHVEAKANELVKADRNLQMIYGQIIQRCVYSSTSLKTHTVFIKKQKFHRSFLIRCFFKKCFALFF